MFAGTTNLAGDGQADLKNHGGIDKAVLAYSADHYPKWRDELGMPDMPYGAFGENLTIAGLSEQSVCIGDVFRIGDGDLRSEPAAAALLEACPALAHARTHTGVGRRQRAQRLVSSRSRARLDRGGNAGRADRAVRTPHGRSPAPTKSCITARRMWLSRSSWRTVPAAGRNRGSRNCANAPNSLGAPSARA